MLVTAGPGLAARRAMATAITKAGNNAADSLLANAHAAVNSAAMPQRSCQCTARRKRASVASISVRARRSYRPETHTTASGLIGNKRKTAAAIGGPAFDRPHPQSIENRRTMINTNAPLARCKARLVTRHVRGLAPASTKLTPRLAIESGR